MRTSAGSLPLLFALLMACGSEDTTPDLGAPVDSGGSNDSGVQDLGSIDAGDSGLIPDAGPSPDAAPDSGPADAEPDAGVSIDAAEPDATPTDAAEADATLPTDGGSDAGLDAGPDGGPGVCAVEGIYGVNIQGMVVYFSFDPASGAWVGAQTIPELTTNPVGGGTYSYANGQFTIEDAPNGAGCNAGEVGVYAVSFTPTCDAFTLTLISEGCQPRGESLDGATFTR